MLGSLRDNGSALLLVVTYCGFLVIALAVSIAIGYEADEVDTGFGVMVFILAFFTSLWLCWVSAVRVTAPRLAARTTDATKRL